MNAIVTIDAPRRRTSLLPTALLSVVLLNGCALPTQGDSAMIKNSQTIDGAHDFDFVVGRWHIVNQRLVGRLQGSTKWETFDGSSEAHALPGGIGNTDSFEAQAWRPGFVGVSLRVFSPETGLWSIFWLDNKTGGLDKAGTLLPPVVGKFNHGVGIFEGDDTLDNKPVRVRYIWSEITGQSAKWEQTMSADGGKTWESNWVMHLTRLR
jgi:hypothetical protein